MPKPRRKASQSSDDHSDNLTQTFLHSYFQTTKTESASQPPLKNKKYVRTVISKKPVPAVQTTPVKFGVMQITKATPLLTTVEKLKPRLLQRKELNNTQDNQTNKSSSRHLVEKTNSVLTNNNKINKLSTSRNLFALEEPANSNVSDDSDVEFVGEIVDGKLQQTSKHKSPTSFGMQDNNTNVENLKPQPNRTKSCKNTFKPKCTKTNNIPTNNSQLSESQDIETKTLTEISLHDTEEDNITNINFTCNNKTMSVDKSTDNDIKLNNDDSDVELLDIKPQTSNQNNSIEVVKSPCIEKRRCSLDESLTPPKKLKSPTFVSKSPTFVSKSPTYVPKSLTFVPKSPTYVPKSPTYVPKSPTFVPKSSTYVPKSPTFVPKSPTYVPTSPTYVPTSPTYVPKSPTFVPKSTTYVPKSPTYVPKSLTFVPKSPTYFPTSSTYVPKSPTFVPKSPTYVPKSLTFVPKSPTYVPKSPTYFPTSSTYVPKSPTFVPNSPTFVPKSPHLSPIKTPNRSLLSLRKTNKTPIDHNTSDTTIIADYDEENLASGYKVKPKQFDSSDINLEDYGIKLDDLLEDTSMNETKNSFPSLRVCSFANEPSNWCANSPGATDGNNDFRFCHTSDKLDTSNASVFTELDDVEGSMKELRKIMKYVASSPNLYSILFDEEKVILQSFFEMPDHYQMVCFRLFTRLSKWYNMVQFLEDIEVQMEKDEIFEMFRLMKEKQLVFTDYTKDPAVNLLSNLSKKDVKSIFDSFKLRPGKSTKKNDLISAILTNCNKQTTLTIGKGMDAILLDRIKEKMGNCVKLDYSFHNILFRIHLLYSFSNPDLLKPFDLYLFMRRVDSGEIDLPAYSTDFTPLFRTKEEFLRYSLATESYNEYILAKEKKKTDQDTMLEIIQDAYGKLKKIVAARYTDSLNKPDFLKKFTAGHVYAKTMSLACKDFTKRTEFVIEWLQFLLRQDQYLTKSRGQWYNQLAMAQDIYLQDTTEAGYVVAEGLCDPKVSIVEQHELSMRARALIKRQINPISEECEQLLTALLLTPPDAKRFRESVINANAIMKSQTGTKRMYTKTDSTGTSYISVEQVVLDYYATPNYPKGIHCEGALMTTMFFVLFWDIIYDLYVPSTFLSEIQAVPLDMRSGDFYKNRKVEIEKRLDDIQYHWGSSKLKAKICENALQHAGKFSPASSEMLEDPTILVEAAVCLGRGPLGKILRRLVRDFGTFHAGMPDLFLWNYKYKKCRFIEVKGEGDQLSMKQKLWLEFLRSAGCDVEVSLVNTIGSKVRRGRKEGNRVRKGRRERMEASINLT